MSVRKFFIVLICIIILDVVGTYLLYRPDDLGLLPEIYKNEAAIERQFEFAGGEVTFVLDVGYHAIGIPAAYIIPGGALGPTRFIHFDGGVFYPTYLLINIIEVLVVSFGIAYLWERRARRHGNREAVG